ncbi:MAG: RDD family protein [Wolbachia sp.]
MDNYAGITRRIIAGVIDHVIVLGIVPILCFVLIATFAVVFDSNELGKNELDKDKIEVALDFLESNESLAILFISIFFVILETLMITRFSGTPGQLLCGIHIKDANTLKNVTTTQAAIRCILREIVTNIICLSTRYVSIWFAALIIVIIFAIFNKRKQFFHDKIARTVAIYYKPSN